MSLLKEIISNFYRYILPLTQNIEGKVLSSLNPYDIEVYKELGKKIYEAEVKDEINNNEDIQKSLISELRFIYNFFNSRLWESKNKNLSNNQSIQEVGEATSKPYEWEITSTKRGDVEFTFTTDSGVEYDVQLVKLDYEDEETGEPINGLEVGFGAGEKGTDKSDKAVINRGEVFRVMATITNIIQTGIKLIPDFKNTNALIYNPAPKKGEDVLGNQRDKLYQAFIKKVFPKARFETDGSALVAKLFPPK